LKADGADVALIEVEVVDREGRRCPTNLNMIDFELSGPAEWRGGIAQGPDNYILAKSLPVECGVNRVMVRSTTGPGKVVLSAKGEGLKPARIEFTSKTVSVANGLATSFPTDGLPCYLERGPTPARPSFAVSRVAVPIARAFGGTNDSDAGGSFDDNETTGWTNDSNVATARVNFEFGREAAPDTAVLKLRGWRERSYPLRITLDGREVYRGNTPRSLGYVTLPLKPVTGRKVQVELAGVSGARDGFNITELENQQNAATGDTQQGNGTLGIVEAEFYESARPD
jgi:beta-galactosidase